MLGINKLRLEHFFNANMREVLVMQLVEYVDMKHNIDKEEVGLKIYNEIENIRSKLKADIDKGDRVAVIDRLDYYNNNKNADKNILAEMIGINNSYNPNAKKALDIRVLKALENKNQARGQLDILLLNDIADDFTRDNIKMYKALFNYRTDNDMLLKAYDKSGKVKLDSTFSKTLKKVKQEVPYNNNKEKSLVDEVLHQMIKAGETILDAMMSPMCKYLFEKLKRFEAFVGSVLVAMKKEVKQVYKLSVRGVNAVKEADQFVEKKRREIDRRRKLKYRMY